jgi:hypothetical protein
MGFLGSGRALPFRFSKARRVRRFGLALFSPALSPCSIRQLCAKDGVGRTRYLWLASTLFAFNGAIKLMEKLYGFETVLSVKIVPPTKQLC